MYVLKRYKLSTIIRWTQRELIFFFILATVYTVLYEFLDLKWLQLPFAPIGIIGTAVAFMVGFQNNSAYDRIWEARKIWGGVVNTSRSFIITVRDSFYMHRSDASKDESETVKIITNRHIAWITALRYAMRSRKGWETYYDHKHRTKSFAYLVPEYETPLEEEIKHLLSKEEFDYVMSKDNKPNALISLQSKHLRRLTDEKKLWDFSLLNFQNMLAELTALQGKSERIKNFPYPKQYASIGYHFVHIFMWLLPLAIIPTFAALGVDIAQENPIVGEIFVWLNIPFTVAVIWIFNTMLRIGLAGENPFEGSPNDVPISNISRGITRDILQIIDEDSISIPKPFDNVMDVEM
jgi:putative membrane protein